MNKILIIGGTNFIGRNLVDKLLSINRFDLAIFNRGITNPDIFPQIQKIKGDRDTDEISKIGEEDWDYIIDLSCYHPDSLLNILKNTTDKLKRYIFISTCSVYDNDIDKSFLRNETASLLDCNENERKDKSNLTYGKRKAECERVLQQSNIIYVILRPSLVYGIFDNTDRFYYWLYQVNNHHEILIPNQGKSLFSVTYVKDLVNTIIESISSENHSQVFNVTTFPKLSISMIIEYTSELLNKKPKLINATSKFLNSEQINQWTDMPLWLDCDYFTYDNSKLIKNLDVQFTEFKKSIAETIAYYQKSGWAEPKYGINETKKQELIEALKLTNNNS